MLLIFIFINKKKTKTPTQQLTTSKHRQIDSYQPRLPIYHPFVNAPVPPTPLQSPVIVYVNGSLTNNTPDKGELAKENSQNQPSTQDTSFNQPSTPKNSKN